MGDKREDNDGKMMMVQQEIISVMGDTVMVMGEDDGDKKEDDSDGHTLMLMKEIMAMGDVVMVMGEDDGYTEKMIVSGRR